MAEGVEGIGIVGHPPDELPGQLTPPQFLWKEESRLMAPPPSCSGMAVGAVAFEQFTPPQLVVEGQGAKGGGGQMRPLDPSDSPRRSLRIYRGGAEELHGQC